VSLVSCPSMLYVLQELNSAICRVGIYCNTFFENFVGQLPNYKVVTIWTTTLLNFAILRISYVITVVIFPYWEFFTKRNKPYLANLQFFIPCTFECNIHYFTNSYTKKICNRFLNSSRHVSNMFT
jgi:hypothetical protein